MKLSSLIILLFLTTFHINYAQQTTYNQSLDSLKKNVQTLPNAELGSFIHRSLSEVVFPYWYGTIWDYNGYTNTPKNGVIACGYFVSTTLKHFGFNLNRYDVAKKYSSSIVKTLCLDDYETYNRYDKFLYEMYSKKIGLYIIGLSNHVGFIEKTKQGELYFIHSNYMYPGVVCREKCSESMALQASTVFWVGNFSNNLKVQEYFLNKTYFTLVD
jgi:hypothetical protein